MAGEGSWVSKLKEYNKRQGKETSGRSPLEGGGDTEEDKKLLEESYIQFKGESSKKYSVIPKFYSKVQL